MSKQSQQNLLWYAVHTKPRQEKLAELSLKRLGLQTFSPKLKETKVIRWREREIIKPLFPGYIFSKFDARLSLRAVKYAHGVIDVVRFGGKPAPVDEEIIAAIESRMKGGYVQIEPRFRPGEKVTVESGPLRGFSGIFEREMSGSERVVILLETISYQARFVVDKKWLKKM